MLFTVNATAIAGATTSVASAAAGDKKIPGTDMIMKIDINHPQYILQLT